MVLGLGMRTIWISLRAINYTDQAFRASIRNVQKLKDEEKALLKAELARMQMAKAQIMTGMLQAATGYMMAQSIGNLMTQTQVGAQYMKEFNQTVQELKTAFADTLFVGLKPLLDVMKVFMNLVKDNSAVRVLFSTFMVGATVLLLLSGITKMLIGLMSLRAAKQAILNIVTGKGIILDKAHTLTIKGKTLAYTQLAVAVAASMGAFVLMYSLLKELNNPIVSAIALIGGLTAALWALFIAESAASLGAALVAGGVAAAGALALSEQYKSFQMGTRSAPYTGPMYVHKGEVIFNPATGRPTQIANDLAERRTVTTNQITLDFSGSTIHTKADKEELMPWIKRALREALRAKE